MNITTNYAILQVKNSTTKNKSRENLALKTCAFKNDCFVKVPVTNNISFKGQVTNADIFFRAIFPVSDHLIPTSTITGEKWGNYFKGFQFNQYSLSEVEGSFLEKIRDLKNNSTEIKNKRIDILKFVNEHLKDKILLNTLEPDLNLLGIKTQFKELKQIQSVLKRVKKMNLEEYRLLTEQDKKILRKEAQKINDNIYKVNPENVINISKIIKYNLDNKFGEGEYVLCSIGRSPALFANVFDNMGLETKICKYSKNNEYYNLFKGEKPIKSGFEKYKKYLDTMGLNVTSIKNSNKKFVFIDYEISGETLRQFEKIIKHSLIGLDLQNVKFENMNEVVANNPAKVFKNLNYGDYKDTQYETYMEGRLLKEYSILSFNNSNISEYQELSDYKIKLFRFALWDSMHEQNLLKNSMS